MKRIMVGVLTVAIAGTCAQAQRRLIDGGPANGRQYPIPAEHAQMQWWLMSGALARPDAPDPVNSRPRGVISAAALKIPEGALREMQKFFKDFDAGKLDDSIKHISKAIKMYPEWSAAHHNLAQTYARMERYDEAIVEFQNAAELDGTSARSWIGLSKIYFLQKKYGDGETAARRALEIDVTNVDAPYYLARNLVSAGKATDEAMALLEKSKERYAPARLLLANIYLKRGSVQSAVDELRGYTAQPDAEAKDKVECMVRKLTEPEGTVNCAIR